MKNNLELDISQLKFDLFRLKVAFEISPFICDRMIGEAEVLAKSGDKENLDKFKATVAEAVEKMRVKQGYAKKD